MMAGTRRAQDKGQAHSASLACQLPCTLGESLLWDTQGQRWCWTDIEDACAYTWGGSGAAPTRHALPDRLGCLAICRSGRWLLGMAKALAWGQWQGSTLTATPFLSVEADQPDTRINDGRTDRQGRFVFGTLHEPPQPQGAQQKPQRQLLGHLYQFCRQQGLRRLALPPVRIANSLCFSPDGRTLYFTDTPSGLIQQCSYDSESAVVGAPVPFAQVAAPGWPDGSVVDADGCLWNAQWGAGRVQRFSPRGEWLADVHLAAPHVTCPAFGGPDLRTLMLTSARQDLSAQALAAAPDSGSLFSCQPAGCQGLPDTLFDDSPKG